MSEAHKRALIVAFFLSKFDRKGVRVLGYDSFSEAFLAIGHVLGVKSSTVKHMRDSFDPYCSRVRAGWYQRKILRSRANVIAAYDEFSEGAMAEIIKALMSAETEQAKIYLAPIGEVADANAIPDDDNPIAKRIQTGERAENIFMEAFSSLEMFRQCDLEDTRKLGIGFDFRASLPPSYFAIEVKGIREARGAITLTDREWTVASILRNRYILAIVRALDDFPFVSLIPDPVGSITVRMRTIESVSICWQARV